MKARANMTVLAAVLLWPCVSAIDPNIDWNDFDPAAQDALKTLGMTDELWKSGQNPDAMHKQWTQLSEEERSAAQSLGFTDSIWEASLMLGAWPDLSEETRDAATLVGFSETTWNEQSPPNVRWSEFSEQQQISANKLGFTDITWALYTVVKCIPCGEGGGAAANGGEYSGDYTDGECGDWLEKIAKTPRVEAACTKETNKFEEECQCTEVGTVGKPDGGGETVGKTDTGLTPSGGGSGTGMLDKTSNVDVLQSGGGGGSGTVDKTSGGGVQITGGGDGGGGTVDKTSGGIETMGGQTPAVQTPGPQGPLGGQVPAMVQPPAGEQQQQQQMATPNTPEGCKAEFPDFCLSAACEGEQCHDTLAAAMANIVPGGSSNPDAAPTRSACMPAVAAVVGKCPACAACAPSRLFLHDGRRSADASTAGDFGQAPAAVAALLGAAVVAAVAAAAIARRRPSLAQGAPGEAAPICGEDGAETATAQ